MADFNITALIGADVKNFKAGMRDAKSAFADFKKEAGQTMAEVGDALAKGGMAMTAGITLPVVAGVAGAIKSFADLEQVLGGVNKLFGDSANAVIRNSESAYRRAGVSGVDYMKQVTSFSATLLAGLGGDTVKAAEYADKAILDMADNANTFGTNIGDIQNAYQGFSRDNFTMLDNLRLGFAGTAGGMADLVNESGVMGESFEATAENVKDIPFDQLIEAIHVTQTEMGITGTTAQEAAETVRGSFDSMVAAAKNLAAGLGDPNADVEVMFQVLGETVEIFAGNVKRVLGTMWDNLPLEDWQKWLGIIVVSIGPVMLVIGTLITTILKISGAIKFVLGGLAALKGGFIAMQAGTAVASGAMASLGAALGAITAPMWIVIGVVAALVGAFIYLWKTNEDFRNKVIEIWNAISVFLVGIFETIKTFIMDTWNNLSAWWAENQKGILNNVRVIWTSIQSIFNSVITLITVIVRTGLDFIRSFWDKWGADITTIVRGAWEIVKSIFITTLQNIFAVVESVITQVRNVFQFAMAFVRGIVYTVLALMRGDWDGAMNAIKMIVNSFKTYVGQTFKNLMNLAKNLVKNGIAGIKNLFNTLRNINLWDAGKAIIDGFLRGLKSAYENVKDFVGGIADWIAENKGPISYDKKLLIGAGQAIMQGLDRGLQNQFKTVQNTVSGMAGAIQSSFGSPTLDVNGSVARSNAQVNSAIHHSVNMSDGRMENLLQQLLMREQGIYLDGDTLVGGTYSRYDRVGGNQTQLTERWGR